MRRRALWGIVPVALVLASAVGIAYLGAASFLADRGMIAAKAEEHSRVARSVAEQVSGELKLTLEAVAGALAEEGTAGREPVAPSRSQISATLSGLAEAHPTAERPFLLASDGRLIYPATDRSLAIDSAPDKEYMALLSRGTKVAAARAQQLNLTRRREIGVCLPPRPDCEVSARDLFAVRRSYAQLARHHDSGPEALLGLARLERAADRPQLAAAAYRELARRFGGRLTVDGLPYDLVAALGLAEVLDDTSQVVSTLGDVVDGQFSLSPAVHSFVVDALRGSIEAETAALTEEARRQLLEIDQQIALAASARDLAADLSSDLMSMSRTATTAARGRAAIGSPDTTLVYRRLGDGRVVGISLDPSALRTLAARATAPRERERGMVALLMAPGEAAPPEVRSLGSAQVELLPHLNLVLVQDLAHPDPVDQVVRARGRRHLALSGGLVAVLVLGLVATIRGAARERELARLKSDFVSTVSHELKTPLTSIRMFAEMLQAGVAGDDRERQQRYHEVIVKESERLGLLIANLLDYAQIERGTRRYNQVPVSALDLANEAVTTFARLRDGEGHAVSVHSEEGGLGQQDRGPLILIDREVTVQALLNLLSNATKYGGGQPVDVTVCARPDGQVAIAVRDQGAGIPPAEHERIFREFYRAPAAFAAGVEGTGLGLALVKRHIEAQGGEVELVSEVGRGATFTLVFPGASATLPTDNSERPGQANEGEQA